MRTMELGRTGLYVPVIAVGIMHINRLDAAQAERIIQTCLEHGCIFFDHADVYGSDKAQFGRCEEIFAEANHSRRRCAKASSSRTRSGLCRLRRDQRDLSA